MFLSDTFAVVTGIACRTHPLDTRACNIRIASFIRTAMEMRRAKRNKISQANSDRKRKIYFYSEFSCDFFQVFSV